MAPVLLSDSDSDSDTGLDSDEDEQEGHYVTRVSLLMEFEPTKNSDLYQVHK